MRWASAARLGAIAIVATALASPTLDVVDDVVASGDGVAEHVRSSVTAADVGPRAGSTAATATSPQPTLPMGENNQPEEDPASTTIGPESAGVDQTSPPTTPIDDSMPTASGDRRSPSVVKTEIPAVSIFLAVSILAVVAAAVRSSRARQVRPPEPSGESSGADVDEHEALEFVVELGRTLIDAGDAIAHVEAVLQDVANRSRLRDLGVLVLPTALVVSVSTRQGPITRVTPAGRTQLRLDQVDDLFRLVDRASAGLVPPQDARRCLDRIRASRPPRPSYVVLAGYVLAAAGLSMVLQGSWREIVLAGVLGGLSGGLRIATQGAASSYQPFWPLIAAVLVSAGVFTTARFVDDLLVFPALVAPLVTFLPGATLTTATLELATGEIVAGTARLASGMMQLVLLALGVVAGSRLVGIPAAVPLAPSPGAANTLVPWIGVAVFGIGVVWYTAARRSAQLWIIVVTYVAYSGQVLGGVFVGGVPAAFFGAAAMTPIAVVAAKRPAGPALLVTFLPAFWLLVPGALGLEGVTRLLGDGNLDGIRTLIATAISMVAISLGTLLGLLLSGQYRGRTLTPDPAVDLVTGPTPSHDPPGGNGT